MLELKLLLSGEYSRISRNGIILTLSFQSVFLSRGQGGHDRNVSRSPTSHIRLFSWLSEDPSKSTATAAKRAFHVSILNESWSMYI